LAHPHPKTVELSLLSRRELLLASAAAGAATLLPRRSEASIVSYDWVCNPGYGLLGNPATPMRFGYLTDFNGLGLSAPLAQDLTVYPAYPAAPTYPRLNLHVSTGAPAGSRKVANVVGVISGVAWAGGALGAWSFSVFMSQSNAMALKAKQGVFKTTGISALGFWLADFDAATKQTFEQLYPYSPVLPVGVLGGSGGSSLSVSTTPVALIDGIDVGFYNVTFAVTPVANSITQFMIANTSSMKTTATWGITIGR
jgi:hypothetical protein